LSPRDSLGGAEENQDHQRLGIVRTFTVVVMVMVVVVVVVVVETPAHYTDSIT
jgi:hypothetical protein